MLLLLCVWSGEGFIYHPISNSFSKENQHTLFMETPFPSVPLFFKNIEMITTSASDHLSPRTTTSKVGQPEENS